MGRRHGLADAFLTDRRPCGPSRPARERCSAGAFAAFTHSARGRVAQRRPASPVRSALSFRSVESHQRQPS
jgi:hypothetical protein